MFVFIVVGFSIVHNTEAFEEYLSLILEKIIEKTNIYSAYSKICIQFLCPDMSHMFHKVKTRHRAVRFIVGDCMQACHSCDHSVICFKSCSFSENSMAVIACCVTGLILCFLEAGQ